MYPGDGDANDGYSDHHHGGGANGPSVLSVSFETSTIRSDRVAVARIDCPGASPDQVRCSPVTPGFEIELLDERAMQDGQILVGLRIHRRIGSVRRLCLVRFSIGRASATASITVVH